MHLLYHMFSTFSCHSLSSFLPLSLSSFSPFPVLYLFLYSLLSVSVSSSSLLTPSHLHGDQALLSPSLPQEPLTSAGCGAKVVPLSLPAASGSLCSECLNMKERRGEKRRGGNKRGDGRRAQEERKELHIQPPVIT